MPRKRIVSSSESEDGGDGALESLEAIKQEYRPKKLGPSNSGGRQFILMEASEEGQPKYRQAKEGEEEEGSDVECTLLEGEEEEEEDEEERWLNELVERAVRAGAGGGGGEEAEEGEQASTEWVPPKGKKKKKATAKKAAIKTELGAVGGTLESVEEEKREAGKAGLVRAAGMVKMEAPALTPNPKFTHRKKPPNNLIIHPDDPTDEELCALPLD